MPNQSNTPAKEPDAAARSTLNLRIKPEDKVLIDKAASAAGKNRTEFVLDAARRAAEETLADLRVINVSPEVYQQFVAQLDAPPQNNNGIRTTMMSESPWAK
ncbi:DUF1778 domain-containing protein [Morganella psychrotolerans]|uniref:CopG family transcriptional regulator n=1 Tax=Morganella psychrotolerans TaxID=368603 RepID=A0A1B8HDA4_9GAMM|nr:DUF1778 domain-containing protein [Morganella psychrotolerans]OBU07061.1 CopG family transcriptional regulator [Morganella psychrotolerans]